MMTKRLAPLLLSLLLVVPVSLSASSARERYLVSTRSALRGTDSPLAFVLPDAETRAVDTFQSVNGFAADLTAEEAVELSHQPGIRFVTRVKERHALDTTSSAQVTPPGVTEVKAPTVWSVSRGEGINIVVIDTGLDYTHPEFKDYYAGGYNAMTGSTDPMDNNGHGTHVAGTIAAADNDIGVVGIAPHVKLWAAKVLGGSGSGSNENVIKALDWVIAKKKELGGNWVLNLSLGASESDPMEQAAFQRAADEGILAVAASGNDSTSSGASPVSYPAGYSTVVAVGAIDGDDHVASFSNQGPEIRLVGPGVHVLSTYWGTYSAFDLISGSGKTLDALYMAGPMETITAGWVDGGVGKVGDFDKAATAGKIALIRRTDAEPTEVAFNAKAAGARAIVFVNDNDGPVVNTLAGSGSGLPLLVGISLASGADIRSNPGASITIRAGGAKHTVPQPYAYLDGTSMASPHVAGVAALVWSVAPSATAESLKQALYTTAHDLGVAGLDSVYGYGEVNATAAAMLLAPSKFAPATRTLLPGRRSIRRP